MKKWYQSKTMWVAIATTLIGLALYVTEQAKNAGMEVSILLSILGVANMLLRGLTDKPLSK
jgi:hypothetical protein